MCTSHLSRPTPRGFSLATCLLALALSLPGEATAHGSTEVRLEVTRQAAADAPHDPEPWLQRAALLLDAGRTSEASEALHQAHSLHGAPSRVFRLRAEVALAEGRAADALHDVEHALSANPGDPRSLRTHARALSTLGRRDEAVAALDRAIAHQRPAVPDFHLDRARLLAAEPAPRVDDALAGLDEARRQLGTLVALESYAVELERERGRFDAALVRLDRLPGAQPPTVSWLARRAALLDEAGREDEARAQWREVDRRLAALPAARRRAPIYREIDERATRALASNEGNTP